MFFSSVIGQSAAKKGLLEMVRNNRIPHALMFAGKEGMGGLSIALAFVQFLMCTDKGEEDSCGLCSNCQKMQRMEHADVHFTFPSFPPSSTQRANSKHFIKPFRAYVKEQPYGTTYNWLQHINAENKQGNISSEECREIIEILNLKAYEGGHKVQIVWRPEYLGREGNILLKLIEEPPMDTLLLLIAEDLEDMLPTIMSRVQTVRLVPLPAADIANALTERLGIEPRRAEQVSALAKGSYSEALEMVQHVGNDMLPAAKELLNGVFASKGLLISKFAEDFSKSGREAQRNFLAYLAELIGQAARATYLHPSQIKVPKEESALALKIAALGVNPEVYRKLIAAVEETAHRIERNAHGKTQLLALGVKMNRIVKGTDGH